MAKRITAFILTFVISAVSCFVAYSKEENLPASTTETPTEYSMQFAKTEYGKNLLTKEVYIYVDGVRTKRETDIDKIYDIITTERNSETMKNGVFWHRDFGYSNATVAFVFKLEGNSSTAVKGFIYKGNGSDNNATRTAAYTLFVSESFGDIFSDENIVYRYNCGNIEPTKAQHIKFKNGQEPFGRYLAIRIDDPSYILSGAQEYPRISFLWAYGKNTADNIYNTNLLTDMPLTEAKYEYLSNNESILNTKINAQNTAFLTDGSIDANPQTDDLCFKSNRETSVTLNTSNEGLKSVSFTYDLCGHFFANGIEIFGSGYGGAEVYGGTNLTDKLKLLYKNEEINADLLTKTFDQKQELRYLVIKLYNCKQSITIGDINCFGDSNQKLREELLNDDINSTDITVYESYIGNRTDSINSHDLFPTFYQDIIDCNKATVSSLYGGYVGENKYDIIIFLNGEKIINNLKFTYSGIIYKDYLPKKINVYFGLNNVINAKTPDCTFTPEQFSKDGILSLKVIPKRAAYIRLELAEFNKLSGYKEVINGEEKFNLTTLIPDVQIKGRGIFTNSENSIANAVVTGTSDVTYNGQAVEFPSLKVTLDGKTLQNNIDYFTVYSNNITAGNASLFIFGINEYTGTKTCAFKINKAHIGKAVCTGIVPKTYTGSYLYQDFSVTYNGKLLEENTDYSVDYSNNLNKGTGIITITGLNNFSGTLTKVFNISGLSIKNAKVTGVKNQVYTGYYTDFSDFSVTYNGKKLKYLTDYMYYYQDNYDVGRASLVIEGAGNYVGTLCTYFNITPKNAVPCVKGVKNKNYTGKSITQKLSVYVGGNLLTKNTDYTVKYSNNKYAGKATVTVNLKGNYSGKKTLSFIIYPPPTTVKKATGKKVYFNKKSKISGYQIKYSKYKNFKKSKYLTAKSSYSGVKLKKANKYYFKIRTYKIVGNKKYYSVWSKVYRK